MAVLFCPALWLSAQELGEGNLPANQAIYANERTYFEPESAEQVDDSRPASGLLASDGPMAENRSPFNINAYWLPRQHLENVPGNWSQSGEQISLAAPLYIAPEGGNIWLATGNVARMEISTSAILPDSLVPVPDRLWNINVGVMNFREHANGWKTGAILNVGSASDQPFAGLRDMTANAIGFVSVPTGERDAWSFSLFYSPMSQLPFPIPGIAYIWRPSDVLTANIGIPFSLRYQPTETTSFSMNYTPLTNINVLAKQQIGETSSLYGGYQITNDTYWLSDRVDNEERFYMFDQRLVVGLERKLGLGFRLDISAAHVFDRQVFQATSFSGDRRDVIEIAPGLAGTVQLIWIR